MGAFLHSVHAGVVLICSILFFVSVPVRAWSLIPAVVIAAVLAIAVGRTIGVKAREAIACCGVASVVAILSFVIAASVYDLSYDGQWYHLEAVLQLARGWVPGTDLTNMDVPIEDARWRIVHFPHASAIAGAAVFRLTGVIESAKGWNSVLMLASACLAFSAMRSLPHATPTLSWMVAVGAALSPVATTQWMTFYVDGVTSALTLSLMAACVLWVRRGRNDYGIVVLVTLIGAVLIATKPTAVIPVAAALGCVFAFRLGTSDLRQRLPILGAGVATFLLGVGVAGYSPYVTNTVRFGHPFHPLVGPHSMNFDWRPSRPADFNDMGRVTRLFRSTFGWPQNSMTGDRFDPARLKLPWEIGVRGEAWTTFGYADTRVAGFGPWYALGLVGVVVLMVPIAVRSKRAAGYGMGIVAMLYCTALLNPEAWWARYSPQLWFVPFVVLFVASAMPPSKWMKGISYAAATVLLVNALLVAGVALNHQLELSRTAARELSRVPRGANVLVNFGPFRTNRERWKESGIAFEEGEVVTDDATVLPEMQTRYVERN